MSIYKLPITYLAFSCDVQVKLKREVTRLEQEATAARSEAKAAEARAVQLQTLVNAQTE